MIHMPQHVSVILVRQEYQIFCFVCANPFMLIHYVQLQFAVHLKRLLHTAIDSEAAWNPSVYWQMCGQFWKLNQVQLFCDQNEREPIKLLLFNARACDCTASRDQIRWSGNRPQQDYDLYKCFKFFFTYFQKIGHSTWTQRSKFGRLIPHFGRTLTTRVGRCFELCNGMMW